ncbi:MAG: 16S rRNA (uracil(1498)-N(3))-methyltransferase [Candidatus Magnetominusculus sp. LBB02]|nr:16S rRNA (uracil(1498)-N(3))-methyltransferase [Candidatus Magnetominusculus sp. LBB02]
MSTTIFIESGAIKEETAAATGQTARYILTVLRYKTGGELSIFDEKGRFFKGIITSSTKNAVHFAITPVPPPNTESPISITLCQGMLKGAKMDLVVQKAVELGVKTIVPVITHRTQLDYTRKTDRWKKIAIEAARQSMRAVVPEVREAIDFSELTELIQGVPTVMFYEAGGRGLKEVGAQEIKDNNFYVITGPEGGFTIEEVRQASSRGAIIATLGTRILRAETAAISALTLIQYVFGDMGDSR